MFSGPPFLPESPFHPSPPPSRTGLERPARIFVQNFLQLPGARPPRGILLAGPSGTGKTPRSPELGTPHLPRLFVFWIGAKADLWLKRARQELFSRVSEFVGILVFFSDYVGMHCFCSEYVGIRFILRAPACFVGFNQQCWREPSQKTNPRVVMFGFFRVSQGMDRWKDFLFFFRALLWPFEGALLNRSVLLFLCWAKSQKTHQLGMKPDEHWLRTQDEALELRQTTYCGWLQNIHFSPPKKFRCLMLST